MINTWRVTEEAQATAGAVERRHRLRGAVVEKAGASLMCGLEETDATPAWKSRGRVI
jgi:hypothetical protein